MERFIKHSILLILTTAISGCNLHGWWPGVTDPQQRANNPPVNGCNQEIIVDYFNNDKESLLVYSIQVNPGAHFDCSQLVDIGVVLPNEHVKYTIQKGKLAYFVFAENSSGQCNSADRKVETWVDCSKAINDQAHFNILP